MKRIDVFAVLLMILAAFFGAAAAEETDGWIMCQPDSEVNIRRHPDMQSEVVAWGWMGQRITLDGKKSGKWLHCIGVGEYGEGWIRGDYVSLEEPENGGIYETTRNKVCVRASAGGKVIRRLSAGTRVTVHLWTSEWCVTDRGFISADFLQEVTE